jgi:hypothetical protein
VATCIQSGPLAQTSSRFRRKSHIDSSQSCSLFCVLKEVSRRLCDCERLPHATPETFSHLGARQTIFSQNLKALVNPQDKFTSLMFLAAFFLAMLYAICPGLGVLAEPWFPPSWT